MSPANAPPPPHVLVTNVEPKNGKSSVYLNRFRESYGVGGALVSNLWQTNQTPADNNDGRELGLDAREIVNPEGTAARMIDLPPGEVGVMHRTESVDYGVVLKGTITLGLDDGTSTDVEEGALIVQRGTLHKWTNNTKDWVRILFVIVPAKKVQTGNGELGTEIARATEGIRN